MEWVLNHTSPTPDSEPRPQSTRCAEPKPEPNIYREPEPAVTDEPLPERATEPSIAPELEPVTPDQVQEPATDYASVDYASGSTMAPSSLLSTVACQSPSSTRLPYPPALPWLVVDYPPLHDSTPLAAGSLCPSGCTTAFRISTFTLVTGVICSCVCFISLRILCIALALGLSISASDSISTCSTAVGRSPGVINPGSTMALPSVESTIAATWVPPDSSCSKSLLSSPWLLNPSDLSCSSCLLPGSSLRHHHLGNYWLSSSQSFGHLLTLLLPVGPSLSPALHCLLIFPSLWREVALSGRGANCHNSCTFEFVFISSLTFLDLVSISPRLCHYVQVCLVNYSHLLSQRLRVSQAFLL